MADRIPLEPVRSSSIAALGYDARKQIVALQFKSGVIYHYAPFPEALFVAWCQAESIGRWYAEHVRGKLPGQKMTGHCSKCGAQGWVGDPCDDCGCSVYADDTKAPELGAAL